MSDEDLPLVLISAADISTAEKIISDLTDNVDRPVLSEYVWQLSNKYYSARVRLRAAPPPPHPPAPALTPLVEGHLMYLAPDECNSEVLHMRLQEAQCSGGVRLALCARAEGELGGALRRAAAAARVELVAMEGAGEGEGEGGMQRVREALHAHVWPGMQTHHSHTLPVAGEESGESVSEEEWDEGECVRRAELLARALGAAGGVRAQAGGGGGGGRGERLARAEQLLAAFCTALGTNIDRL